MLFVKCFLLLFVLYEIDAGFSTNTHSCSIPRLRHGRARTRQRSKMVKFICFTGYELVGNKYATCKNGEWDEPFPVCVRPGCKPIPKPENGIQWISHRAAWVITFCLPGYALSGSSIVYCDGVTWNATAPVCVESKAPSLLSCDFEDPDICGWTQDDLHDFDWKRQHLHTPSHFLNTGPAYDHTYGKNGDGYYMYIESTSKLENDTARLLSPIYSSALAKNGCFSFFYHMFGKTTGGLKVYQKPDNIALQAMLQLPAVDQKKYQLFEKWGDQGDTWFRSVDSLNDFNDNFQIVIEGIRGSSFTSDIAVDDVAILQGENCTAAREAAVTPSEPESDSCVGRCDVFGGIKRSPSAGCGCTVDCTVEENCCPDFFEICVFEETSPDSLPQTQKLVASTTSTSEVTTTTVTPSPMRPPIARISPSKIPNVSTSKIPSNATVTQAWTTKTTTLATTHTATPKRTPPAAKPTTTSAAKPTPKRPLTLVFKSTTAIYNATGKIKKDKSTVKPIVTTSAVKPAPNSTKSPVRVTTTKRVIVTASPTSSKVVRKTVVPKDGESRGLRTGIIVITSLVLLAGLAWFVVWSRGAQGRSSIARLRGRTTSHPEVRFLTAHEDDEA